MQFTVRNLLIFVACVGVALGQARLPIFVGLACLMPEILILGWFVLPRLSFWLSGGILLGLMLGLVVWMTATRWTEVNPASFANFEEWRSAFTGWMAWNWRFGPYCFQVGALVGGTVGLILGQIRFLTKRRTLAVPISSDLR